MLPAEKDQNNKARTIQAGRAVHTGRAAPLRTGRLPAEAMAAEGGNFNPLPDMYVDSVDQKHFHRISFCLIKTYYFQYSISVDRINEK